MSEVAGNTRDRNRLSGSEQSNGPARDGTIRVTLRARVGACLDCLVSDDLLVELIRYAIAQACGDNAVAVQLVKVGFE